MGLPNHYRQDGLLAVAHAAACTLLHIPLCHVVRVVTTWCPAACKDAMSVLQLEAIVRRVICVLKQPDTKVLVFSTWQDVLELLAHALRENNVWFAHAKSGSKGFDKAVKQFKGTSTDASAPVLLLLVKQGSHGLNLTGGPTSAHRRVMA